MIRLQHALTVLAQNDVDFVIVGGVAASLHGSTYATYDLDVCYSRDPANLERLARALAPYHPRLRAAPAKDALHIAELEALREATQEPSE